MARLPQWLNEAVKANVITLPQAKELAELEANVPEGQYVDVPEHLHQATANLWLWEVTPHNELPV